MKKFLLVLLVFLLVVISAFATCNSATCNISVDTETESTHSFWETSRGSPQQESSWTFYSTLYNAALEPQEMTMLYEDCVGYGFTVAYRGVEGRKYDTTKITSYTTATVPPKNLWELYTSTMYLYSYYTIEHVDYYWCTTHNCPFLDTSYTYNAEHLDSWIGTKSVFVPYYFM